MRVIYALILALCAFACSGAGEDVALHESMGTSAQAVSTPCYIETRTAYACHPTYGRDATTFKVLAHNVGSVTCSYGPAITAYSKPLTSPPTVIYDSDLIGMYTLAPGQSRAHTVTVSGLGPLYWNVEYRYRNNGTTDAFTWHDDLPATFHTGPPAPSITCSDFPPI